jgi:hypothetical protein
MFNFIAMSNKENILLKSNNGNIFIMILFILIMLYAVIWCLFNATVLLFFSLPLLIITCLIPRTTIVTESDIYFNYPFRLYGRRKRIPLSFIKNIGTVYGGDYLGAGDYKFTIGYYNKKTNGRFKLKDYKEIEFLIKDKEQGKLMFNLFEKYKVKNPNDVN